VVEAKDGDERNDSHANSRISVSAGSSQNRMSMSRYIVVAVVSVLYGRLAVSRHILTDLAVFWP
jgi:hypothetical protein